jgi:uncharacterized phiE125 gp8 family phage protein
VIYGDPIRTVAPAVLPLSLAEVRAQCRLTDDDGTDEDALLIAYLRSATEYAERHTGLSLISSTWKQTFQAWPHHTVSPWRSYTYTSAWWSTTAALDLPLRRRPLQSVSSIVYLDGDGLEQTLDPSVYRVLGVGEDKRDGSIRLGYSQMWPVLQQDPEAVTVTYKAGFGDDHNAVPEQIRLAIMLLVAYWFNQRETALIDPEIVEVPLGTHALLREWRPLAVA